MGSQARRLQRAVRRRARRVEHETAEMEAGRVLHYNDAHLWRRGGDVTLCGKPVRKPCPADSRYDKLCTKCSRAADTLLQ